MTKSAVVEFPTSVKKPGHHHVVGAERSFMNDDEEIGTVAVDKEEKGLNMLASVCIAMNMTMGAGWIACPAAMARCGIILGAIVLGAFALLANMCKNFLIETMARAEAIMTEDEKKEDQSANSSLALEDPEEKFISKALYRLTGSRKFEMSQLSALFLPKWMSITFGIIYCFCQYATLLGYCQIFAVTFATVVGEHMPSLVASPEMCADPQTLAFGSMCYSPYALFVAIYFVLTIILAVAGYKETFLLQVIFSAARILVLLLMVITLLADTSLSRFGDVQDKDYGYNETSPLFYFNFAGLGFAIPVMMDMFVNLDCAPAVAHDMRASKRGKVREAFAIATSVIFAGYVLISVVASGVLVANGKEVFTQINILWAQYGGKNPTWWELIIRYLVTFFGPIDVLSCFPIKATSQTYNIVGLLFGNDSEKGMLEENVLSCRRWFFFLVATGPSVLIAFFVTNLGDVLEFKGPLVVAWAFIFPIVFAMFAYKACVRIFGFEGLKTPYTSIYSRPAFYWTVLVLFILLTLFLIINVIGEYGVEALKFD